MMPAPCAASSASATCRANGQRVFERDPATREALRQVFPFDQFHDERGGTAAVLDAVDVGNVRMIERRENLGFTLEPHQALRIGGHAGGQHLDRNVALQARIAGAIHLTHPTRADRRFDAIGADARARRQRHGATLSARAGPPGAARMTTATAVTACRRHPEKRRGGMADLSL